jgi:hypothetical protein
MLHIELEGLVMSLVELLHQESILLLWVLHPGIHAPAEKDPVVILYGSKMLQATWDQRLCPFVEGNFLSPIVVQVGQNKGFGVCHVQVHVLPLEEEGFEDLRKEHIVGILGERLQLDALELVHVGEDHDQVLAH